MFYKFENEEWLKANEIHLPNEEKLDVNNKENELGWIWYDEAPQDYLDWINPNQIEE